MRALARLLGVSPSTVFSWRTKGPSARGVELLKGVPTPRLSKPKRGAPGPVRRKAQQLKTYVEKFEKRSEAAKKSWKKRKKNERCKLLFEEWADIHADSDLQTNPKDKDRVQVLRLHLQNRTSEFTRFMKAAGGFSFTTKEAKDFWFSPKVVC